MMKGFLITNRQIEIIESPNEFYKTILALIERAKNRISIASLYLGTGHLEQKVIDSLSNRVKRKGIELNIIMDKNRCERKEKGRNSLSLLNPLSKHLYLYNNINSSHLPLSKYIPSMLKELLGVFHTKIIVSDSDILLTGANLSNSYFTSRKDRYMLIRNHPLLADYLYKYIQSIKQIQYSKNKNEYITNHKKCLAHFINTNNECDTDTIMKKVPNDIIMLYPSVRYK